MKLILTILFILIYPYMKIVNLFISIYYYIKIDWYEYKIYINKEYENNIFPK